MNEFFWGIWGWFLVFQEQKLVLYSKQTSLWLVVVIFNGKIK
jgi:hypothetical protein